ncbi:MAG: hypothetical protein IJP98_04910 [Clostridia bacterium]|nr:hypothetical protein [Clostridia bacterium]
MTTSIQFWDYPVWDFLITLSALFLAMLLANGLRRSIPFLKKSLIPSSVIGGFLVLLFIGVFRAITGTSPFSATTVESLTYHGLGLGIVAMTFQSAPKRSSKEARRDVFNSSLITVSTYLIQAIVGLVLTVLLFYLLGNWSQAGILLPMGYGQGPGQAFNWGTTYMNQYGFAHGSSFGLSIAACGFLAASIGGVIYLNIAAKKGKLRTENAEEKEDLTAAVITTRGEIPLSESLDKLTVQFALVFSAYGIAYGLMLGLSALCDLSGVKFLISTVKPLIWGFNFLFGMLAASILKAFFKVGKKAGFVHRNYTNDFLLTRISGLMFDLMVVASIASIDLSAFRYREFWLPLLLVCITGGLVSFFYVRFLARRFFAGYVDEQFLVMYGMLTGTVSTGLILLREVDPLFKTPAANNVIYQNLWSIILGAPMLLLLGLVAKDTIAGEPTLMTFITLGALVLLFALMLVLLFRNLIFRRKQKTESM